MTQVYINGYSFDCALGSSNTLKTPLAHKETFEQRVLKHEGEPTSFPYFNAFSRGVSDSLSSEEIFALLEQHIFQAMDAAGWAHEELNQIPLFFGSTSYLISADEKTLSNTPVEHLEEHCYNYPYSLNVLARYFQKKYNHRAVFTLATSCASSAHALLYAHQHLRLHDIERAIVIGFELFSSITLFGFHALELITPTQFSPFTTQANGLILGEGVAAIALSRDATNKQATLAGGATLCDTHHIATTLPDGEKVYESMEQALANAGVTATELAGIKAHATGSQLNDRAELLAIERLNKQADIGLLKPFIGHTLGACGALECALWIEFFTNQSLPSLPSHFQKDTLLSEKIMADQGILKAGYHLLNYLGFGGNNVSLVLGLGLSQ